MDNVDDFWNSLKNSPKEPKQDYSIIGSGKSFKQSILAASKESLSFFDTDLTVQDSVKGQNEVHSEEQIHSDENIHSDEQVHSEEQLNSEEEYVEPAEVQGNDFPLELPSEDESEEEEQFRKESIDIVNNEISLQMENKERKNNSRMDFAVEESNDVTSEEEFLEPIRRSIGKQSKAKRSSNVFEEDEDESSDEERDNTAIFSANEQDDEEEDISSDSELDSDGVDSPHTVAPRDISFRWEDPDETVLSPKPITPKSNAKQRRLSSGSKGIARRRAPRTRVKPVEFWRNEKVIYNPDGKVKDVVKLPKEDVVRSVKVAKKKPSIKGFRTEKEVYGEVYDPNDQELATLRIAVNEKGMKPKLAPKGTFKIETLFSEGDSFSSGIMVFPRDSEKPSRTSVNHSVVFVVLSGAVRAIVGNAEFIVTSGSQFYVPRGNQYKIQNIADGDTNLSFCHFNHGVQTE